MDWVMAIIFLFNNLRKQIHKIIHTGERNNYQGRIHTRELIRKVPLNNYVRWEPQRASI